MAEYDLYTEVKCPKCGQMRQKVASFCPHCGYVVEESWWEKVVGVFRSEETPVGERKPRGNTISALLSLGFIGYLLYTAIEKESVQSLIVAVIMLVLAVRAWLRGPRRESQGTEGDGETLKERERGEETPPQPLSDKFFCENCGTEVGGDAVSCPKCGMHFGG